MSRTGIALAALTVILVLGSVAAVVIVLLLASSQAAVLVGVIGTLVLPSALAMMAAIKADNAQVQSQVTHDTVQSVTDKLSKT